MRNRKKHKTIDDFSVSQLLDDFLKVDALLSGSAPKEVDDEDYIRMMLKKGVQKKLERTKRETQVPTHHVTSDPHSDTIDDNIRRRFFPDVSEKQVEKELPPQEKEQPVIEKEFPPDNGIVAEILDSIVVKDVSGLAAQMKEAVDFVQDEMGTSESERRLIEALEECMKPAGCEKKKSDPLMYNDNILVLKRCQNCYFCVGEKNRNGSLWCLCTNPDRSTDVEIEDSWVKSKLNLSCWKAPQD
jgi:hypothetical protein